MMMIDAIDNQSDSKLQLGYRPAHPLSATATGDTLIPMYASDFANPDPLKTESDLTYSLPVSRKRSRDYYSVCTFSDAPNVNWTLIDGCATFTLHGDDVSSQIQRQQLEIDRFVARHIEKVKREIEDRRRQNLMKLIAEIEEGVTQRLRAKEEEITKMMKLNCALEDNIKSLSLESQIWHELAETNEATANALRVNLTQVMEQVINDGYRQQSTAAGEDAQSCCESNGDNERMLAEQDSSNRLCKCCGEVESSVLLLPCRHLCLCTVCVSSVDICPICKSSKNISVRVHLS